MGTEFSKAKSAKCFIQTWAMALLVTLAVWQADAAEKLNWLTDLPKAQAQAKQEDRMVLMNFTGSDWCSWCIKLDKEIFQTADFAEYAGKNLVLMEVDFPKNKPQSKELEKANEALEKKYKVEQYPTVIVLNSEGKKVGELGYVEGGPQAFIRKLEKLKGKPKS